MLTSPNASGAFLQDLGSMSAVYIKQIYELQKQTADATLLLGDCHFIFTPESSTDGTNAENSENEAEDLWFNYLLARAKSERSDDNKAENSQGSDDEQA